MIKPIFTILVIVHLYHCFELNNSTDPSDSTNSREPSTNFPAPTGYGGDDGIPDELEVAGETFLGLPLYDWGARSNITDIFVYVMFMDSTDPGIQPQKKAFDMIRAAFSNRGIAVHFDLGNKFHPGRGISPAHYDLSDTDHTVPYRPTISFHKDPSSQAAEPYDYYFKYMPVKLRGIFFCMILGSRDLNTNSEGRTLGTASVGGIISLMMMEGFHSNVSTNKSIKNNVIVNLQASVIMHELGHNLGLEHGGHERENYKPNYYSVMNYLYGFGLPVIGDQDYDRYFRIYSESNKYTNFRRLADTRNTIIDDPDLFRIDYSDGMGGNLDENSFHESTGLLNRPGSSPVDIDENGSTTNVLALDLNSKYTNAMNAMSVLRDHNDWDNLRIYFARGGHGLSLFNAGNAHLSEDFPLSGPCCPPLPEDF